MIAWDLDGTLCDTEPVGTGFWSDPVRFLEASRPLRSLINVARNLGPHQCFITGRTPALEMPTRLQLLAWFGPDHGDLFLRPMDVDFQDLTDWKAHVLQAQGCRLFIGDSRSDQEAALQAGCRYMTPAQALTAYLVEGPMGFKVKA